MPERRTRSLCLPRWQREEVWRGHRLYCSSQSPTCHRTHFYGGVSSFPMQVGTCEEASTLTQRQRQNSTTVRRWLTVTWPCMLLDSSHLWFSWKPGSRTLFSAYGFFRCLPQAYGMNGILKRHWVGGCSKLSLTTNVNSSQTQHSEPADAGVSVLSHFKHNQKDFIESWLLEVKIDMLQNLFGISDILWFLVERFEQVDLRVNKTRSISLIHI